MLIYVCECLCVCVCVCACVQKGEKHWHTDETARNFSVCFRLVISGEVLSDVSIRFLKYTTASEVYKLTSVKPQLKHLSTWRRRPVCADAARSKLRNSKCHGHRASPCEILQIVWDSSLNPGNQSKPFENRPWATYSGKTLPFLSCGGEAEDDWALLYGENLWVMSTKSIFWFCTRNRLIEIHNIS